MVHKFSQIPSRETLAFKSDPVLEVDTPPTNSMYKTAKNLQSLIVLKSQQSKCQTNWRRLRQLQLPNFQLPTVSIFSSRFTRLYKSPLISIFTDLSFVQGFLHNGPNGFLRVTNLSCCILKLFYHLAIPKLNHLAPFAKDFTHDFTGCWADDIFENAPNQTTSVDGCRCPGAQFPNDSSLRGSVCNDSRDSGTSRVFHYLQKRLALQVHVFW